MAGVLDGADCSWPSSEELQRIEQIRQNCKAEIAKLMNPARDLVGDVRLCRYLRFYGGDVDKASKNYEEFLQWRAERRIEEMRKNVIDLPYNEFMDFVCAARSPWAPPVALLGENADGHILIYAMPGFFKAQDFVSQRPACHTMDTDLAIAYLAIEYALRWIDDNSYKFRRLCYSIKIINFENLGTEKIPIFVSEIRNFAKTNVPGLMKHYCEHDILIMALNAPFMFKVLFAFMSALMAKRQVARLRIFSSAMSEDAQKLLKAVCSPSQLPVSIGGSRQYMPGVTPFGWTDKAQVQAFMARTDTLVGLKTPTKWTRGVTAVETLGTAASAAPAAQMSGAAETYSAPPCDTIKDDPEATPPMSAPMSLPQSGAAPAELLAPENMADATAKTGGDAVLETTAAKPAGGWFCCS